MQENSMLELIKGRLPLLISMPHIGTVIPNDLQPAFCERALGVEDTDWHLRALYDFCIPNSTYEFKPALRPSLLMPTISRYVIDLNRPPDDTPMYPGASNTELCPTRFFTGDALYREGCEPKLAEQRRRRELYWQPYHDQLQNELVRLKQKFGYVLLWDAHSIRSQIPWLFEGKLPDLNIGTASGASADESITHTVSSTAVAFEANEPKATSVVNGRFKGGFITRHYGDPEQNVHAIQLEKCQSLYMQESAPFIYETNKAQLIKPVLHAMLSSALQAAAAMYGDKQSGGRR
jgi:N-formylglutamate deformylase